MVDDGADIVDVGGEPTRPGADRSTTCRRSFKSFANYSKATK